VPVLVDTNILLDLVNPASEWTEWSLSAIRRAADDGPLFINESFLPNFQHVFPPFRRWTALSMI